MTLNLLTYVPEGMVLLVDSMSTSESFVPFQGPKVTTYDHAMKLFELGTKLRAAAMISGVGDIGGTLVSQLLRTVSRQLDANDDADHDVCVETVIDHVSGAYDNMIADFKQQVLDQIVHDPDALTHLNQVRAAKNQPPYGSIDEFTADSIGIQGDPETGDRDVLIPVPRLEIVVASHFTAYNATSILWPGARKTAVVLGGGGVGNAWWWGSGGSAVSRIIKGYDHDLLAAGAHGGDQSSQQMLEFYSQPQQAVRHQMPFLLSVMPLQEAVYFSEYLGDVACGYDRFKAGPAGVGGAVNVMVITEEKREWLRRDRIQSRPTAV